MSDVDDDFMCDEEEDYGLVRELVGSSDRRSNLSFVTFKIVQFLV